jgi:NADH-quinone oxidoreductase subunit N
VPFGFVALAVAMSAVSLYYYLQVLKRAFVVPALDDRRIAVHPVTLATLLFVTLWVVMAGCFPALLQGWMESFYALI